MSNLRLKTGIRYGIVTSLLSSLIGLALFFTGLADYSGSTSGWVGTLILILGIYLASEGYKKENNGFMSHSDLVVTSLWMGLIGGLMSAAIVFVHLQLDPDLFSAQLNRVEADMENKGMDDASIEQAMSITRKMMQPVPMALTVIVSSFIFTVILSSILGFFLKKEQGIFDQYDQE
jgi:Protein of unknown function (DUF4199)